MPGLPPIILIHILCAMVALVLGPFALFRARRDRWHKRLGRVWVAAMAATAISSFGISGLSHALVIGGLRPMGPFSPIHLLSVWLLWGLWRGVTAIRAGDRVAHVLAMQSLYTQALMIAAVLTLLPGRTMSQLIAPDAPWTALAVAAGVAAGATVAIRRHGRRVIAPLARGSGARHPAPHV